MSSRTPWRPPGGQPEERSAATPEEDSALENRTRQSNQAPARDIARRARLISPPERRTPRAICVGCESAFVPREAWHQLCPTCHAGAAAFLALRRAKRLLAGAR